MPKINWPENKKSAICIIANDTLINSVKLCSTVAKLDTDMDIITDLFAIVNPLGKEPSYRKCLFLRALISISSVNLKHTHKDDFKHAAANKTNNSNVSAILSDTISSFTTSDI